MKSASILSLTHERVGSGGGSYSHDDKLEKFSGTITADGGKDSFHCEVIIGTKNAGTWSKEGLSVRTEESRDNASFSAQGTYAIQFGTPTNGSSGLPADAGSCPPGTLTVDAGANKARETTGYYTMTGGAFRLVSASDVRVANQYYGSPGTSGSSVNDQQAGVFGRVGGR
jgi:hypothetical protein